MAKAAQCCKKINSQDQDLCKVKTTACQLILSKSISPFGKTLVTMSPLFRGIEQVFQS